MCLFLICILQFVRVQSDATDHLQLNSCSRDCLGAVKFTNVTRKLDVIKMQNNDIKCICEGAFAGFYKTKSINLSFNEITDIHAKAFPKNLNNLQRLDISHNGLTKYPPIPRLPALRVYDLSHNLITDLGNALESVKWHYAIHLHFNRLTTMKKPAELNVTIFGNPWTCDYRISWMRENTTAMRIFRELNPPENMTCNAPDDIKGQSVYEAPARYFEESNAGLNAAYVCVPLICIMTVVAIIFLYCWCKKKGYCPVGQTGDIK